MAKDKNKDKGNTATAEPEEKPVPAEEAAPVKAKKEKKPKEKKPEVIPSNVKPPADGTVNVQMLAEEFQMLPTKVRQVIRGLGLRAPEVDNKGAFGPRNKYSWEKKSADLATIKEALKKAVEAAEAEEDDSEEE